MKQYGIDPRLVIWIQKNTGHDLQTFSDLAKIKCLDSRKRNFSAVKKIEDVRLPSWLVIRDDDFSLIGEMTKLKQLSLHDVAIDDYSFLSRCRNLNTLNLQDTNFSDCRLLTEFPALKKVFLPAYSQLKHKEVLEQLSCLKEIKEEKTEKTRRDRTGLSGDRAFCGEPGIMQAAALGGHGTFEYRWHGDCPVFRRGYEGCCSRKQFSDSRIYESRTGWSTHSERGYHGFLYRYGR
jgi:hypothetical protein